MNDVSEKFIEYGLKSENKGTIRNPDGYGKVKGECGDTIEYFIRIEEKKISDIKCMVDGCINSNACANALITVAKDKSIKQVLAITPNDVDDFLETLPKNEFHCAEMAIDAIELAIKDHLINSKNSWKKQYLK